MPGCGGGGGAATAGASGVIMAVTRDGEQWLLPWKMQFKYVIRS